MWLAAWVVVVAGLVWIYLVRLEQPRSFEIAGPIRKIEGNSIFVDAVFYDAKNPGQIFASQDRREVEVVITPRTRFVKTVITMPSREELEKSSGYYEPGKLPRQEALGSLDDLRGGAVNGIFAISAGNIYSKTKFEAAEVRYILSLYPE